ncbi:hypothetical protein HYS48_01220 [Candidatus Woesearchaeota archaeon]|nr:hypothetical protein [Candidatus Woesearchaeota archaeon]
MLCILGVVRKKAKKWTEQDSFFLYLLLATATVSIGGILAAQWIPRLLYVQFFRASAFFYPVLLYYAAFFLFSLWEQKSVRDKTIAVLLSSILIIPAGILLIYFFPQLTESVILSPEDREDKQITVSVLAHLPAFHDLVGWAEQQDKKNLFLAPPYGFADAFRAYGKRGVVSAYKDGVTILMTQPDGGKAWYERYAEIRKLYLTNDTDSFTAAAEKYQANYIIVAKEKNSLELPLVYENDVYAVYLPSPVEDN